MDQSIEILKEEAMQRMQMSQEFTKFLRKAYEIFGDPEVLVGKNITPLTFWFYIDALYYYIDPHEQSHNMRQLTSQNRQNAQEFDEMQDLQFILKLRKLISEQKMGTLNIEDIRSTPLDEVIEIAQTHLYHIQKQNNEKLETLKQREKQDQQKIKDELEKMNVKFRNSHPMFYYEQLQAILRAKWIQEEIKQESRQRCYLCFLPNKLITCNVQTCSLKVHDTCYPTFASRFDHKATKPTEQELRDFVCENCKNKVDTDNQKCELCCCIGGHFVKTYQQEDNIKIKFNKQNVAEENIKNTYISLKIFHQQNEKVQKYVHLACSIWNTDLKWNSITNMVQGLHKTTKKKSNGICSLCGISFGAIIPCSNETCRRFYHAECAKRHKLEMKLIRAKTPVIQLFCERHRHLNKHESIEQAEMHRFREVKKMFEGLDKEIKRFHVTSSYQQVKLVVERDYCSVCGKQENRQRSTTCKQCRKWYHNYCSQNCKNCN